MNKADRQPFDVSAVRGQFPLLRAELGNGRPLVYLDNAATTQKPRSVIERLNHFYARQNANIHRGVYHLSQEATAAYESARQTVQRFVNAAEPAEILFTRGTTESINLVAASWGGANLSPGDEVIISAMEHHSNIVPWQMICQRSGAVLRVIPMNDRGELLLDQYQRLLGPRTKIVSVVHVSNSLGTVNDVRRIVRQAHAAGAIVLIDGAQWVAHGPTDVQALDADFYAFSGHKLFGPTGIGILYARRALLEAMPPYQGGGDMIASVSFEKTVYAELPGKFEAGTPHIAGAVGLSAAIDFVHSIGFEAIAAHERDLLEYATRRLSALRGLRIIGTASDKASVISFVIDDPPIATMDLGMQLDQFGIAIRTGHHCCQPVMDRFGIAATARASLSLYNTTREIDALADALEAIIARAAGHVRRSPSAPVAPGAAAEVQYPGPFAPSVDAVADELAEVFDLLEDREARTQYVLELGDKIPPVPEALKTETTRVQGCMSIVHLYGRTRPGTTDVLEFVADSDAHIVRGLIGLLEHLYSGQRAGNVLRFDIQGFLTRIGLDQFISTQRRNGLAGMIQRIRGLASSASAAHPHRPAPAHSTGH